MKENNNAVAKRHTQAAVELLKTTLTKHGVDTGCIQLIKDAIYIAPKNVECLSAELLGEIRDIFFWTKCIVVEDIDGLVRLDAESNTILINLSNYEEIAGVREKLVSYGTVIKKLEYKRTEFSYEYDLNGIKLQIEDLAAISNYYHAACTAESLIENHPEIDTLEKAMAIGYEVRNLMCRQGLEAHEAINQALRHFDL